MEFGELVRSELDSRALSIRAAAKKMHRDPAMLSRVVNGHQAMSLGLAEDLDTLCGTGKFVKAYRAGKQPRKAAERGVDPMLRREILRLAGASGAMMLTSSGYLPAKPAFAEFSQFNGYAAVSSHLWRFYGRVENKADVFPAVAEHLQSLHEALTTSSNAGLCALHSEALQLSGEVLFDQGHHDDSIAAYVLAASAAKEAKDYDRWATALVRWSLVLNAEQRWADSRELLTAAARVAARGDRHLPTRQWVASVRAEVAAAEGDASEAERSLDAASTVLELTAPGGWLRYSGDRLSEQRASAFLALGEYAKAEAELEKALQATLTPRRAAAILVDQARLRVRQGAAEAARESVEAAAEIASRTKSDYVLGKLAQLRAELEDEPDTAELSEVLSAVTKGQ
ncbi:MULTISPECIES: hypothetical protein [Glycomyces]|uniref:Tetratricopeptide (TPR) repeat protein n=2 Tax=Glycomyces TaxID=58113 RepID=A0A9X3SWW8_9ACTN|nr:hypothetical protein [Glycomyces lechevalierae]MDA1386357.1 hypothetical protein [Glycomyces lechevalierae]MDR7338873.1 tetratricopeptide (TPR) repeat protein [Glycomyces lechevalierae]